MLRLARCTVARGGQTLIEGADLTLFPGQKLGLTGANGSGKSTLFALITGELSAESGDVTLPAGWVLSHVEQQVATDAVSAHAFVLAGDPALAGLLHRLKAPDAESAEGLAALHNDLEACEGYAAPARASELLAGLGFSEAAQRRSVADFSGGWRMRLALARALMRRADLLLLDEPTNYLDLDAVLWLEDWLKRFSGALIVITHDRDFLDAVVDHIAHIERRTLTLYRGNYSAFEAERAARLALQQSTYVRQQRSVAHLQAFIDRFRAKATKARQAQSRLKTLERMERISAAHVDSAFTFSFAEPDSHPRQLFALQALSAGYAGKAVLTQVDWSCWDGDRIGLLGPNGAGKSTLLKTLVGELLPVAGQLHRAEKLKVGYFTQYTVDALHLDLSPLQHLQRLDPAAREQSLRDFLGGFDFRGNQATAPVAPFSGGEKARLALALIVYQRPNLLLLDEPTNHLDMAMREALARALQAYSGALIVVAHDRHLLKATTDQFLLVADGQVRPFDGDLDEYRDWVLGQRRVTGSVDASPGADRKAEKRAQAEARQRLADARKPLQRRVEKIEGALMPLQQEKDALDHWLASEAAYQEGGREDLPAKIARQGQLSAEIARLEEDWLWAQAELEALVRSAGA
jgi:ATP-binding cassette subfamily F protein 3